MKSETIGASFADVLVVLILHTVVHEGPFLTRVQVLADELVQDALLASDSGASVSVLDTVLDDLYGKALLLLGRLDRSRTCIVCTFRASHRDLVIRELLEDRFLTSLVVSK